jgi:hypothetical protein
MATTITGSGVDKVIDGSITSTKILDGTITNADINASAGIVGSKLTDIKTVNGDSLIGSGDLEVGGGKVLQVVSVNLPTPVTVGYSASWQDLSGMSVAITPSTTTSKIYIMCSLTSANSNHSHARIARGSTAVGAGIAASNRPGVFAYGNNPGGVNSTRVDSMNFLDSPNTTSPTTYKVQLWVTNGTSNTVYINRTAGDADDVYSGRGSSTLTLMEIGA